MKEEIVDKLKKQHQKLKVLLAQIDQATEQEDANFGLILEKLNFFKADLQVHLSLEDNFFYPKLIEKMKEKKMQTEDTLRFIHEMKVIGASIADFMKNYDEAEKIKLKRAQFKADLGEIISRLVLRVESEEDGVYLYWSL